MLDVLLTGGESSRFQQNLVKGKQSVIQYEANLGWPFASADDYKDPGHYAMILLHNPNFKGAQIVEQVQEEIGKVQKDGVDAKELDRVKTFFRAARDRAAAELPGARRLLGQYELLDGNPDLINTEMASFLAVTPDQIQAAAQQVPAFRKGASCWRSSPRRKRRSRTNETSRSYSDCTGGCHDFVLPEDRPHQASRDSALPVFKLPSVFETALPNGLRVVLVEDRRFPLVTLRLAFQAGSKFDPKDLPGLSEAVATLLTEGHQDAPFAADRRGTGRHGRRAQGGCRPGRVHHPGQRARRESAEAARPAGGRHAQRGVPGRRGQALQEPAHPGTDRGAFATPRSGPTRRSPRWSSARTRMRAINPTPESIGKLDRKLLAEFRDRHLVPNNAVLILLGAIPSRDETLGLVTARLGSWQKKDLPARPAAEFPASARSITLVDRPGSVQADIRVGRLAVDRTNPDYFPLVVANTILGGGASSRMFTNIREKQGFAYDAHSSLQPRRMRACSPPSRRCATRCWSPP